MRNSTTTFQFTSKNDDDLKVIVGKNRKDKVHVVISNLYGRFKLKGFVGNLDDMLMSKKAIFTATLDTAPGLLYKFTINTYTDRGESHICLREIETGCTTTFGVFNLPEAVGDRIYL